MTIQSDNAAGHDATAVSLAHLEARLDGLFERQRTQDKRLSSIEESSRKVAKFVDECTGGRSALLLLLKVTGALVAMAGVAWAIFRSWKVGG